MTWWLAWVISVSKLIAQAKPPTVDAWRVELLFVCLDDRILTMAVGDKAGLLDEMHPQSRYKTRILERYVKVFVGKVASAYPVFLVDGYAGTGSCGNEDGSAAILLSAAINRQKSTSSQIRVRAVESKSDSFKQLESVFSALSGTVDAKAIHGKIELELNKIADEAMGHALFLFLDPYGASFGFEQLVQVLSDRSSQPPTELLLNLNAGMIKRNAGIIRSSQEGYEIPKVDKALGGQWWHKYCYSLDKDDLVEAVTTEYVQRLADACSQKGKPFYGAFAPIYQTVSQVNHPYSLVFLTRRPDHGFPAFLNAVGASRPDFLEAAGDWSTGSEQDVFEGLETTEDYRGTAKKQQTDSWIPVRSNIINLLTAGSSFYPAEEIKQIYGDATGVATETQVNKVLRDLVKSGILQVTTSHKNPVFQRYRVQAATGN